MTDNLQCCKAVVERNVESFESDDTLQRERVMRLPLFVFHLRQSLQPLSKFEERFLFSFRLSSGDTEREQARSSDRETNRGHGEADNER